MESKKRTNLSRIMIASAVFLLFALCIVPASADNDAFTDNNKTYVKMENTPRFNIYNNDMYYFIFNKPTGGLKAIHITNDTVNDIEGDTYTVDDYSGTFYITDTSTDTQYHDDAILMFAIPDDDYINGSYADMELTITVSGYQWTPTGDGDKPDQGDITYQDSVSMGTYDMDNLTYNTSAWRPAGYDDYPVYEDQDVSENEQFHFTPIDLYHGTLNESAYTPPLYYNGSVRVDYTISGYNGGAAVFDVYAFNNQSNQGKGVSWTNALTGSKSSGWKINL